MRKPIIAGNWKMNKLTADGISLAQELKDKLPTTDNREVVICPPFTLLSLIAQVLKGSNVILGAQNVFAADSGAYTGEISPLMLKDLGIRYCIIGHSERRQYFKENDVIVNQKVKEALKSEIKPIICIGESLEEREKNLTFSRLKEQIAGALSGLVPLELAKGLSQNNVNHLPEVILERDKEQRVLRSKATQTMSDAVAAQKRPGPSVGVPSLKHCGVAPRLCATGTKPSSRLALTLNLGLQIVNLILRQPLILSLPTSPSGQLARAKRLPRNRPKKCILLSEKKLPLFMEKKLPPPYGFSMAEA